jgi:hypothetical protein
MIAARREEEDVYEELAVVNPLAVVALGFEDAYIGFTVGTGPSLAVYDYDKCVEVLVARDKLTEEEAQEYLDFNTVFAYVGEHTPKFLFRRRDDDT